VSSDGHVDAGSNRSKLDSPAGYGNGGGGAFG
jgi:hypothetical protein